MTKMMMIMMLTMQHEWVSKRMNIPFFENFILFQFVMDNTFFYIFIGYSFWGFFFSPVACAWNVLENDVFVS